MQNDKPLPNTKELGSIFGKLANIYQIICGPTGNRKELPTYVSNVMGDGIVPSFRIHIPDDSYVGKNGKPFHVGRAVDFLHVALKSLMINFKFSEKFPPENVQAMLDDKNNVNMENIYNTSIAPFVGKGERVELSPSNALLQIVLPNLFSKIFSEIKEIKITLENRSNASDTITVTLPNEPLLLNVQARGDKGSRPADTPVPLAAVLWALQEGRTAVLGSQHTALVKYFVGLQTAFTEHMHVVQGIIQKQLDEQAPGKQVKDYLYLKEEALKGVIRAEAHHLGVARMVAFANGQNPDSLDAAMKLAYVKPPAINLKNDTWAARDTAVAIYSAVQSLDYSLKRLEMGRANNDFLHKGLNLILSEGNMLGKLFHKGYSSDTSEALKIADAISMIKPEQDKPLWRTVQATIRAHPVWVATLQDIWLRTAVVNEVLVDTDASSPGNYAHTLLGELVPQITRPQQLAVVKRATGIAPSGAPIRR